MLNTVRNRLFASYLAVLFIALSILAFVLIGFLQTREVPAEFTWQRLELLLSGFASQQFVRDVMQARFNMEEIEAILDNFAAENGVRVLFVVERDGSPMVLYDSADIYEAQTPIVLDGNPPRERPRNGPQPGPIVLTGRFVDENGEEWLYTGFTRPPDRQHSQLFDNPSLMLALPASSESLSSAWADFSEVFLAPILRSACISGVAAFLFAIFISRSIVQPLQMLSRSAQEVAKGQFSTEVPEKGPVELKQVASAFNRMTGEVRSAQESQREFLANVSHDLKTPLTSIQGYSQAIMDGAARNPADAAEVIHEEAERLTRMVTELTDLARIQAGRLSLKMTALDVSKIADAMAERLAIVAAKKKISIRTQTSPMPQIAGDGDRLVQVFTNLIGNAIKYTPNGGQIHISTGVSLGGVEIIIKDNGIGIPPEDLPRLFERFYQVDKSRGPSRGTGLGLAITHEIVQAHGGKIRIESAGVNQGTTVTVWLPSPQLSTLVSRRN